MAEIQDLLLSMRGRVKRGGIELLPTFRSFDPYVFYVIVCSASCVAPTTTFKDVSGRTDTVKCSVSASSLTNGLLMFFYDSLALLFF